MKENAGYRFKFSLVCAVYNVEDYVAKTLDSFIAQDIGFEENVQVILVNDGSDDKSGEICDEYAARYPKNITVVHKENGGVSTARNTALDLIEGKYYNFCDPDDLLTSNTLSSVWNFFEEHESETDVVTIPMEFFEAYGGVPYHNCKFNSGTRLIDLNKEHYAPLFSSSSSFIHHRVISLFKFDTRLKYSEDAKYINLILMEKCTLGVVADCKYMYRRRSANSSAINSSQNDDRWYFDTPRYFFLEIIDYAKKKFGGITPKFLQHTILCDFKWRVTQKAAENKYLASGDDEAFKKYLALFTEVISEIEPDVVMDNPFYDDILKLHVLKNIQKLPFTIADEQGAEYYEYRGRKFFDVSKLCALEFCFFEPDLKNGTVDLYLSVVTLPEMESYEFAVDVNGIVFPLVSLDRDDEVVLLGMLSHKKQYFKATLPLDSRSTYFSVKYSNRATERHLTLQTGSFGRFFPLNTMPTSYYSFGKYILKESANNAFLIRKASRIKKLFFEAKYEKSLLKIKEPRGIKIILYRWYYFLHKFFSRKKQMLIMDRINKADDNAEVFFSYLSENKPRGTKAYFAIAKGNDYERLKKSHKHIVEYNTKRFYKKYIVADALISSHVDDFILAPMGSKQVYFKDITCGKKTVFLQHGVTQNDISSYLNKFSKNISAIVTASPKEREIFSGKRFCYKNENIWMTGFPRFDRLYNDPKKLITVLPTWRSYLATAMDLSTGRSELAPNFEKSSFYQFYNRLLNDEELLGIANEFGYKIQFMPHPIFAPHINRFDKNQAVTFLDINRPYREIFSESALILTDYSSAVFDFAYLGKPIVYAQFDRDELSKKGTTYSLDTSFYDNNAFGEICFDYDSTCERLIEYIKNDCRIKPEYKERMENFFLFNDKKSCERIVEKLKSLHIVK